MLLATDLLATAALLFQMSYVFTAVGWASAHGAFSIRDIALVAIPFAVVWTGWGIVRLRRPVHGNFWLLALSVIVLLSTELILPVTPLKARSRQAAVDGTLVRDLADELVLSGGGHPIGVRLTYTVQFPDSGVYSVGPSVAIPSRDYTGTIPSALHLGFRREPASSPVPKPTEEPGERYYLAGVDYKFTADLVPSFLPIDAPRDEPCLAFQPNQNYSETEWLAVVTQGWRSPYQVEMLVDGESVTQRRVPQQYVTTGVYDVSEFYESLLVDGVTRCSQSP